MEKQNTFLQENLDVLLKENNLNSENGAPVLFDKTIIPQDINDFAYSKKSHIKFFKENYYDYDLFGEDKSEEQFSIYDYQKMLCYFFIQKFVPPGSKILQLGKGKSEIFDFFETTKRYECWKLNEIESLSEDLTVNGLELNIFKHGEENKKLIKPFEYFDFIFSISDYDVLRFDNTGESYKNINYNLKRLLRHGGYVNFMFTVSFENGAYHLNNYLYSFFAEIFPSHSFTINYLGPNSIPVNTEVFLEKSESSKFKYINFTNKDKICEVNVFSYNILIRKKVAEIRKHILIYPEYYRKKTPAYFFHHLIKCGGSSIGAVLEKWFQFDNDLYDKVDGALGYDYGGNVNNFKKYKFNLENISSDTCIRGHFQHEGIFIHQRYPEIFERPDEFKVFTFVRDPMKVLYSLYYFGKKRDYDYQKISLETYLKTTKNFLAYLLNCDDSNYKEILDRYFFIGIVDRMQESFDKLASLIGKRRIQVPVYNTTEKDSQIADLSPEFIEKIKQQNELDFKIYNYCLNRFNKL